MDKVALIIDEAEIDKTGTYKVKVSNDLGSEELSTEIKVEKGMFNQLYFQFLQPNECILPFCNG